MDASTILSTILILFLLYVAFKWAEIVVRHKKLWAHFDRTPGVGNLVPLPKHWLFGQIIHWVVGINGFVG